jgi:hypothetical protein
MPAKKIFWVGGKIRAGVVRLPRETGSSQPGGCMGVPSAHEVTQLLRAWSEGDSRALEKLTPLVYEELHRAAHRHLAREQPGHLLQTTALINEVYLRLVDFHVGWQDRAHFASPAGPLRRPCGSLLTKPEVNFLIVICYLRANDAAHSHRRRPVAAVSKARRRCASSQLGRSPGSFPRATGQPRRIG